MEDRRECRLSSALFDTYMRRWRQDGWRVKRVPGAGYKQRLRGQVRESDNTVLLYPDDLDEGDTLEYILLHEMVHIFEDLDGTPAVEHALTWRVSNAMWRCLNDRQKGVLTAIITMEE